ncbi:MAG: amidinotransferase [Pseudodesulfovibrio sp.]|uniref:Dimethylargininase n=1 Tax=Pseudodesulfovibrio aespoeensis (strain ATCC 700646 / DSM 10631 / Aspo-2) TaxID=643562 RepID=E6VZI6_PSEA9|nr:MULTISPECIES: arginine deiminase family protein [Pseudodesulfovibrio]MBU4191405.1 amidinotransferase [Pseudomonadota bacterium]ADU61700.1 Dimethylargininase [Pseudodesulfovibrio aespoeensis Aspo-2]MBU4244261.1 amidinotransferase [Pseudomonadota bacterium]MBU4379446.1 amidinotransferase [Pseudomonadota bacterium]MBU4474892.1 amidinotransferase [Pseudomonadota bacterium]
MFTHAITRRPSAEMANGITTADLGTPDYHLALAQHKAYCLTLAVLGLDVTVLDAEPGYPDCCFVEDTAVVCDHVAALAPLGAPSRQGEETSIEPVLARFRPVVRVRPPALFEGGDVLQVDDTFFIGLSERTNMAGAKALGNTLARHGSTWHAMEMGETLHFKTDVSFIGDNTLLVSPFFETAPELARFRRIVVDENEAYARNCLFINGTVIVPAGFPRTLAAIKGLGRPTIELDMSEFRKLDGGLTCLSLRF